MQLYSEVRDGVTMLALEGEIDGSTAPPLQDQIIPFITDNCRVLLDMSRVSFMSSAGLRVMLLISRQIAETKGIAVLIGLSEDLHSAMDATGFLKYFKLAADFDAAWEVLTA